jgi:hypothetical protein
MICSKLISLDARKKAEPKGMTSMSRKDFELIAQTINELQFTANERTCIALAFARRLATTNPNFDPDRFFRACGVEEA